MFSALCMLLLAVVFSSPALAHDPVFGLGPHVLFKGGVEVSPELHIAKQGDEEGTELGLNLTYGITGDWAAGIELPYRWRDNGSLSASGSGDVSLFTKYRFWRHDTLGVQQSASAFLKIKTDTGDLNEALPLGTGSTDTLLGLTYGYESRKWYRWAAIRYRLNNRNDAGLRRGDKVLLDLVAGIRLKPTGYREPDTVWLLELNGEYGERADFNGIELANTGGTQWFLSPGIFWTLRNFAVKAGVQVPIASDLNGDQVKSDYRAKLVLEWHL